MRVGTWKVPALKKVASLNLQINESGECEFSSEDASDVDSVILHRVAGILRSAMSGITCQASHYAPSGDLNVSARTLFQRHCMTL